MSAVYRSINIPDKETTGTRIRTWHNGIRTGKRDHPRKELV